MREQRVKRAQAVLYRVGSQNPLPFAPLSNGYTGGYYLCPFHLWGTRLTGDSTLWYAGGSSDYLLASPDLVTGGQVRSVNALYLILALAH